MWAPAMTKAPPPWKSAEPYCVCSASIAIHEPQCFNKMGAGEPTQMPASVTSSMAKPNLPSVVKTPVSRRLPLLSTSST